MQLEVKIYICIIEGSKELESDRDKEKYIFSICL